MSDTLVVAGLGMVAHRLVAELREHDHDDRWRVVAIGEETHHAYDRVGLSSYLDGRSAADLARLGPETVLGRGRPAPRRPGAHQVQPG